MKHIIRRGRWCDIILDVGAENFINLYTEEQNLYSSLKIVSINKVKLMGRVRHAERITCKKIQKYIYEMKPRKR
jgi:hypothetical protein